MLGLMTFHVSNLLTNNQADKCQPDFFWIKVVDALVDVVVWTKEGEYHGKIETSVDTEPERERL